MLVALDLCPVSLFVLSKHKYERIRAQLVKYERIHAQLAFFLLFSLIPRPLSLPDWRY